MNKKILSLAVATAFAGSAFADGHGMTTSVSGLAIATHANVKASPEATGGKSTDDSSTAANGDSQVQFNFSKAGENSSVTSFLRFKHGGDIRISASAAAQGDMWSVKGMFERDINLSNGTNEDGNITKENTAYGIRDVWVKAMHASGAYVQLGHDQYLDNFVKGKMSVSGGDAIEATDNVVLYSGEDRFNALKLGFASDMIGVDAALVYIHDQCDIAGSTATVYAPNGTAVESNTFATSNATQACAGVGGVAFTQAASTGVADTSSGKSVLNGNGVSSGMAILASYNKGPVSVSLENLSLETKNENADTTSEPDAEEVSKKTASALGASFDAGVVTPFLNYSTQKLEKTLGTASTTFTQKDATNIGALVPLGNTTLRVSFLTAEYKNETEKTMEVAGTELGVKQALGAATFEATYGTLDKKDKKAASTAATKSGSKTTYLGLQLSYAF